MSLTSLLLRVVLCVSLIANGAGFAQASTRMQLAHAMHALPVAVQEASGGCHDAQPLGRPTMDHAAMGHDVAAETAAPGTGPLSDCCDEANCECVCLQHASMAFMAVFVSVPFDAPSTIAAHSASQHATPRLPHLIRPPIG